MATTPNPLTDVIPAVARKYVYAFAVLAALVVSLWQAADGNWVNFVASLLAALVPALAASNTSTPVSSDGTPTPAESGRNFQG